MARLGDMLRHAQAHSPFWRKRFAALRATPADIRTAADLALLPTTTREDLREPDPLLAADIARDRLKTAMTSGSTGRRTMSYFDREAWIVGKHLLKLRARLACGMRPTDRLALFQEADPARSDSRFGGRTRSFSIHIPPSRSSPTSPRSLPACCTVFPDTCSPWDRCRGPDSAAADLHVRRTPRSVDPAPDRGPVRLPGVRCYGSTETKEIAWECPARVGYHINADWLLVETLPADGRPSASRIIVTSLYNRAMPLIRYELGDTGQLLDGTCSCGRGLPLMRPTWGRSADYFLLADGTTITPYDLPARHLASPGRCPSGPQRSPVGRGPGRRGRRLRPCVTAAIQLALSRSCTASSRSSVWSTVLQEPSGKFRIVRSELGARAAEPAHG